MTRRHRSRRGDSAPGWVWMSFGLALGLTVAIVVYLRTSPTPPSEPVELGDSAAPTRDAAAARAPPARRQETATPPAENRFQFYEILPQVEVDVPTSSERSAPAARPRQAAAPGSFLLQAGSFSAAADADRLQANLALMGFESHVQRVQIDDAVFNRVRIGPLDDLETARQAQRRLRDAGIDALLMQIPK